MSKKRKIVRVKMDGKCSSISKTKCAPPLIPDLPCLSICDCCVSPLQYVLQQLMGQTVLIATIADAPNQQPRLFLYTITGVNDFLVTVVGDEGTFVVNISDIIGVGFSLSVPIPNLLPPVGAGCDCDCRERPIRQLLGTLTGSTVNLLVSNGSVAQNFHVEQTGLGIVLGTLQINMDTTLRFAISTCKITAVWMPT